MTILGSNLSAFFIVITLLAGFLWGYIVGRSPLKSLVKSLAAIFGFPAALVTALAGAAAFMGWDSLALGIVLAMPFAIATAVGCLLSSQRKSTREADEMLQDHFLDSPRTKTVGRLYT